MFDGMAVAIQKPPLSSDTNNWKLKKVMIVTASTVNTLKNQLLINNLLSYFATDCILYKGHISISCLVVCPKV